MKIKKENTNLVAISKFSFAVVVVVLWKKVIRHKRLENWILMLLNFVFVLSVSEWIKSRSVTLKSQLCVFVDERDDQRKEIASLMAFSRDELKEGKRCFLGLIQSSGKSLRSTFFNATHSQEMWDGWEGRIRKGRQVTCCVENRWLKKVIL